MSMNLKPQDILVVLKLVKSGEKPFSELASELGMSASEVHAAVKRAAVAGLLDLSDPNCRRVQSNALYDYLVHGVPRSFPAKPGPIVHGMPTAHAALPLSKTINMGDSLPPVWADAEGTVRGYELMPLYKSVPRAARNDPRLYELLALVDALRAGRARERQAAATELRYKLLHRPESCLRLGSTDISENDIDTWSGTLTGSEAVLPELVRRIVVDLVPSGRLARIDAPANKAVNQPGFDIDLQTVGGCRFASTDLSVWELSTRKVIREKANEDFNKAVAAVDRVERQSTTYVALTSRIWRNPGKSEWLREKLALKEWADVRAYDASDMAQWLTQALSARLWFARKYAVVSAGMVLMDDYYSRWAARTPLEICEEIVLAARVSEREKIDQWISGSEPRALYSRADTLEESVVFLCAALRMRAEDKGQQWRSRVIIATSAMAWKEILIAAYSSVNALVLIPAFCEFDGVLAGTEGHYVFVPRERGAASSSETADIELGPIPRDALAKELEGRFMRDRDEAREYACKSGGKLSALQRLLGYCPPLPDWAKKEENILGAFLLAGAWEPENATDRGWLSELAGGVDYEAIEKSICRLMAVADPPLRKQGNAIKWRSSADSWNRLATILTPSLLSRFGDTCKKVLGQDSPRFDLPTDERVFASLRGDVPRESSTIRLGLADSLALLRQHASNLNDLHESVAVGNSIDVVVRHILAGSWKRWATLEPELPSLAEAAPNAFLESVEAAMNDASRGFAELFRQDATPGDFFGSCCHAGLLWALECLAWKSEYFSRVADILARLCILDKGGSYSNRPKESLLQLFHPLTKQTASENNQRLSVLRTLAERHEEAIWPVVRGILGIVSQGCSVSANYRPRFSDWDLPESLARYPMQEIVEYVEQIKTVAVDMSVGNGERILALFNEGGADAIIDKLLAHIIARGQEYRSKDDTNATALQGALRQWVSRQFAKADDSAPEPDGVSKAKTAIHALDPHDFIANEAWLFAKYVTLPSRREWSIDCETRDAYLQQLRNEAFDRILNDGSTFSQILSLVDVSSVDPRTVGSSLAARDGAAAFDADVLALDLADAGPHGKFACAFLARRATQEGTLWLIEQAEALIRNGRTTDAAATITCTQPGADIRDWVDAQPAEFHANYWQRVDLWSPGVRDDDDFERIVTGILNVHRWDQAIELLSDSAREKSPPGRPADYLRILWYPRDGGGSAEEIAMGFSHHASSYAIPATFIHLDRCGKVNGNELADLEIYYNQCLEHSEYKIKHIGKLLGGDAAFYVHMLCDVFRRASEVAKGECADETIDDTTKNRAQIAFRVLRLWNGYPGDDSPEAERNAILKRWCDEVMRISKEADREVIGKEKVGEVLARVPPCECDGIWPCRVARDYLESGISEIGNGLSMARFNGRGGSCRSLVEGGAHERDAATACQADADRIRDEYPKTAAMLDADAMNLLWYAKRADADAERFVDP